MEREFKRLQSSSDPNLITFQNYLMVMKNLDVPLTTVELLEIFNNFKHVKGNCIRMNDFISAISSSVPSAFFLQADPTYLNELEASLIKAKNRVKELEKFILVNSTETDEYKLKIEKISSENKELKSKINDLNSQILQYFLYREEKNSANPDVIQMKEKIKKFEEDKKTINKNFGEKFKEYEEKFSKKITL